MSSRENFRFSSSVKLSGSVEEIPNLKTNLSVLSSQFSLSHLFQTLFLDVAEFPDSFDLGDQPVIQSLQLLGGLVEHPRVDLSSEEVVGRGDGVDVPGLACFDNYH